MSRAIKDTFYPTVVEESPTLDMVLRGHSIARFGDGELKILRGMGCVSQKFNTDLQQELQSIIGGPTQALIGIPTLDKQSPKYVNWLKLAPRFEPFLHRTKSYYSAFITRPDSAPWCNTPEFFDKVQSLWKGQNVVLVANGKRSLTREFLLQTGARKVEWVECSYKDSYEQITDLHLAAARFRINRVLLCVGPTATCLAERLARTGYHAVDLGHIGMFWRAYNEPKSKVARV